MWRKSSKSGPWTDNCVEIDTDTQPGTVRVRDSKLGDASPVLTFSHDEYRAFTDGIRDGELLV